MMTLNVGQITLATISAARNTPENFTGLNPFVTKEKFIRRYILNTKDWLTQGKFIDREIRALKDALD